MVHNPFVSIPVFKFQCSNAARRKRGCALLRAKKKIIIHWFEPANISHSMTPKKTDTFDLDE